MKGGFIMLFFKDQKTEYKKFQVAFQKEMEHCFVENGVGEGPLKVTKLDYEFNPKEFDKKELRVHGYVRIHIHTNHDDEFADKDYLDRLHNRETLVKGVYVSEQEIVLTVFEELKNKVRNFASDCVKRSKFKYKKDFSCYARFHLEHLNTYIEFMHMDLSKYY